ncbi:hypothetical protein V0Q12_07175 [Limosilactobacillus reuteri]|uniref:Transposase n=1 Tax=Limosilactobacillus reuteri TaxID=1598 RepID=A0A7X2G5E7_LIMRT|nr:hypothetical protein [Limosilactobacillus reuteri]MCC4359056.1 hypothetical protein [Limosilactobacillus reuteri]MCC4362820.1 hypothetical protein [Limosilactobacillus reuteri]MCC4365363.1 hypothetical protein [Limosilactobacillus reuteri]MCC4423562.1 hypothetical protein [Limosilactobacillus reuteri]MEE1989322.1 hypothetical protein [Limosilactobacillus reuteri]
MPLNNNLVEKSIQPSTLIRKIAYSQKMKRVPRRTLSNIA